MKVTPVSKIVGAEVTGVNLSDPITENTKQDLRQALLDHQVLVIRDQTLTPPQQVTFSAIWGDLETPSNIDYTIEETPKVMILSNEIRPDGTAVGVVDGGDFWHSDSSHIEIPSAITILQAVKNPERGGDTEFCNMYLAYEALSEGLKELVDSLRVVNESGDTRQWSATYDGMHEKKNE